MSHIPNMGNVILSLMLKSSRPRLRQNSLAYSLPCLWRISCKRGLLSNSVEKSSVNEAPDGISNDKDEGNLIDQSEQEKELLGKITLLSEEVETLKDKYQRTLADRENVRQRLENQIRESKLFGIQSFCKDLLEVSDVFKKAIESVPEEQLKISDIHFKNLFDGVLMIESQLLNVFKRHGLEEIIPKEGEKFDPSWQEAIFEVESTDKVPGSIADVMRLGWKLNHRCIRSAQVAVVKQ